MDPYSSPYILPNNGLHNEFPHSLLRARQFHAPDVGPSRSEVKS